MNLKVKKNKINKLTGKEKFTVNDMIKLLNHLDGTAEIRFGILKGSNTEFCQEENFIFRLYEDSREDIWEGNYIVDIITDCNGST